MCEVHLIHTLATLNVKINSDKICRVVRGEKGIEATIGATSEASIGPASGQNVPGLYSKQLC